MSFGKLIRETRLRAQAEERKYSLRKTAERIGIQPSYLSKIERGELHQRRQAVDGSVETTLVDLRNDAYGAYGES